MKSSGDVPSLSFPSSLPTGERVRLLMDEILAVLERERDVSEALSKQALDVQRCLVADDYMALLEAVQAQEIYSQQLAQWEHRRLVLTKTLALFFPRLARLRLSDWATYLPEPYGSRFEAIWRVLQKAARQIQQVNAQNMALVQRSLRFAELALGIDSPAYGAPRGRSPRDAPPLFEKIF